MCASESEYVCVSVCLCVREGCTITSGFGSICAFREKRTQKALADETAPNIKEQEPL